MGSLDGRVVIITGGAGGIGRKVASALRREGARLAVMDIDRDATQSFVETLGGSDDVMAIAGDVANEQTCNDAVSSVQAKFGQVDGLINNAGISVAVLRPDHETNPIGIEEITGEVWSKFLGVNLSGAFFMTRAAVPLMKARGRGRIINVTTSFLTMLRANFVPYGPTKAALEAASASWAGEFESDGITVNVVVPGGPTDTPMVPDEWISDRSLLIRPEAMAPPIVWLMSDDAGDVTGQRFIAANWDAALEPRAAADTAGAPAAWPQLKGTAVWPGKPPEK